eukprot:1159521-Pelagomonas_calceolata.AAC.1
MQRRTQETCALMPTEAYALCFYVWLQCRERKKQAKEDAKRRAIEEAEAKVRQDCTNCCCIDGSTGMAVSACIWVDVMSCCLVSQRGYKTKTSPLCQPIRACQGGHVFLLNMHMLHIHSAPDVLVGKVPPYACTGKVPTLVQPCCLCWVQIAAENAARQAAEEAEKKRNAEAKLVREAEKKAYKKERQRTRQLCDGGLRLWLELLLVSLLTEATFESPCLGKASWSRLNCPVTTNLYLTHAGDPAFPKPP